MSEELHAHLELQAAENEKRGMSGDEARAAAQRAFGGVEQIKERARDVRGWIGSSRPRRFPLRAPSTGEVARITVVAVLSLALGIGANTAIFGLVDAVLLRSLPARNPGELVLLDWSAPRTELNDPNARWSNGLWGDGAFSLLSFDRLRAGIIRSRRCSGSRCAGVERSHRGEAEVIDHGQYVTGNYFEALGVRPLLGRMIGPADDQTGAPPVVVISHRLWRRRSAPTRLRSERQS